jgi:hypothetical protein
MLKSDPQKTRDWQARSRRRLATRSPLKCYKPMNRGTKRLRAKPDPLMAAWSKAVLERDENKCQWPVLFVGDGMPPACRTRDDRIDPHHLAERSLRPDLKYDVDNGLALCRTHHEMLPGMRAKAVEMGLYRAESYEKAMKAKCRD